MEAISKHKSVIVSKFTLFESMENYSYQYNIKLVGFPELYEHESANDTAKLCLEIFKAIGASELTGQDIDIAHRVQSRRLSTRLIMIFFSQNSKIMASEDW